MNILQSRRCGGHLLRPCGVRFFHAAVRVVLFFVFWSQVSVVQAQYKRQSDVRSDSLALLIQRTPDTTRVMLLNTIALQYALRNPAIGLEYAREAQELAVRLHNNYALLATLNVFGRLYWEQGNNDAAQEHHFNALKLSEDLRDSTEMARALAGLGSILHSRRRYTQALEYQFKALTLAQKLPDKLIMARALNSIGTSYRNIGNHDSAFVYFVRSLMVYEKNGITEQNYMPLFNLGYLLFLKARYEDASDYVFKALNHAREQQNNRVIAECYLTVADIAHKQHNYGAALDLAEKALRIADSTGIKPTIAEIYLSFSEIYASMHNYRKALEYKDLYHVVNDSLVNVRSSATVAELQAKYDAEKKDKQMKEELSHKQFIQDVMIGIFVFLLVIVGMLVRQYRIKQRSETILRDTNEKILRQQMIVDEHARAIELADVALRESNHQLSAANERLKELNAEKDEFLSIAAHDLKNPINGIQLSTEFVLSEDDMPLATRKHFLEMILGTSQRMLEIIKKLLDVNILENGGFVMDHEVINLSDKARLVIASYQIKALQKNIDIRWESELDGSDAIVIADSNAIEQVLDNLVSNAVKYSPHGKRVWVRTQHGGTVGRCEVHDEGPGLSEDDKAKLFGRFVRLSAQPTGGEHSTGLGLSIVKKLVEAMNGRVWCESELGNGAAFIVELPISGST